MTNALDIALSRRNLEIVWRYEKRRLQRSCFGVDRQTGKQFETRLTSEFDRLRERAQGDFRPKGLLAIAKPKPNGGNRIICVPTIADRFLQFAVLTEIRPALEKRGLLNPISYGLIRSANRTVTDARQRAISLRSERRWVYKADIEKFFDNIPRDATRRAAEKTINQRSLHKVILPFIDTEIEDGFDRDWRDIIGKAGIVRGRGVRQGMPLSPYFAGIILKNLDTKIEKLNAPSLRYVDDVVAFFSSRQECEAFHAFLQNELQMLGLSVGNVGLVGSKTKIYDPTESVPFLGMEITLNRDNGYYLSIGETCIQKIGTKFAELATIENLLKKRITLPKLGGFLDAMENGYAQAYTGAENHSALKAEIARMKKMALNAVLEEALGEHVSRLDRATRRFLGIA